MLKYVLKRILLFIPTIVIITLLTFIINLSAPADPVERLAKAADQEGGASAESSVQKAAKIEVRKKLGLDLPVFYVGLQSRAHPDTLHNILDKAHRGNLKKLVRTYGNWEEISNYYLTLTAAEKVTTGFNSEDFYTSSFEFDSITGDTLKKPEFSLEEIKEVSNRAVNEITALLGTADPLIISAKLDTLTRLSNNYPFFSKMGEGKVVGGIVTAYNAVTENATKWKTYIPDLNFQGMKGFKMKNQYHMWMFGNVPLFSSKAKRQNKLRARVGDQLAFYKSSIDELSNSEKLNREIEAFFAENAKKEAKHLAMHNRSKLERKFRGMQGVLNYLNQPSSFEQERVNGELALYKSAFKDDWKNLSQTTREGIQEHEAKVEKMVDQLTYARFGIVRGDFGISFKDGQPIRGKIWGAMWWSFSLSLISIILAYLISIPTGIYSAYKANSVFDRVSAVIMYILYSVPSFVLAIFLLLWFANPDALNWFPPSGVKDPATFDPSWNWFAKVKHYLPFLVLPLIAYTLGSFAYLARIMRAGMMDVVQQDYIRTARAKGLPEKKVVMKHSLKNSLLPIITIFAAIFPIAIGGSVILEKVFSIPGMGTEIIEAVYNADYPMIMAVFTLFGVLTIIGYLVSDLLYSVVDPRISLK